MIFLQDPRSQDLGYHVDQLTDRNKQASVACFCIPYPFKSDFINQVLGAYKNYEKTVILATEMHPTTVHCIRQLDLPNIFFFCCGKLNFKLAHAQEYEFLDWFISTIHFYKNVKPTILNNLITLGIKPYYFDALLGRSKPHRDSLKHKINVSLPNKGIVTYLDHKNPKFEYNDTERWIWEREGLHLPEHPQWTISMVEYHGHKLSLSQIIPLSVYNQTAYSVVSETNADSDYVFFTEKTVKPILARRLFLISGGRYSLQHLRELGFQTFNNIIDESYDEAADYNQRNELLVEQLVWLCNKPQDYILSKIVPITDHNFNHMMGTDWYARFLANLSKCFR